MTKTEHDKRTLVSRVYVRPDGTRQRTSAFIEAFADALRVFKMNSEHPATVYCTIFSPVDKEGKRRQLKRYVYLAPEFKLQQETKRVIRKAGLRMFMRPKAGAPRMRWPG